MLNNFKNYYIMEELVHNGSMTINTGNINLANWDSYYQGILNIFKDGIETDFVQSVKVDIIFVSGEHIRLTLPDLYFNIIMWYIPIKCNEPITPEYLFFDKNITKSTIKKFIDDKFISKKKKIISFKEMNNIIDDTLHKFMGIDEFSLYLANTINLEDFIGISKANPRFRELLHSDLSDVPIEDAKNYGMKLANESVQIIENSKQYLGFDHCLANSFRSGEGIKVRQYKEFAINVGSKPDGKGGAHPAIINSSYINGGLSNLLFEFIDSSASRLAQIITKDQVGKSGDFARTLGLNNVSSYLMNDELYDCHTRNFIQLTIKNKQMLKLYVDRYYRLDPNGKEYCIKATDEFLIGKMIYLRSPITCASEANGNGVCFRCYGDLAYINRDIKPGKMAAELITNKFTQEKLSAKHQLETRIKKAKWTDEFEQFFEININMITVNDDASDSNDLYILINPQDITLFNEDDYQQADFIDDDDDEDKEPNDNDSIDIEDHCYNEYITRFYISGDKFEQPIEITTEDQIDLFITSGLNTLIRNEAIPTDDGMIKLYLNDLKDTPLFFINIRNDDIGKALDDMQHLLNLKKITKAYNIHSLTQRIIEVAIEADMGIQAVHYEMLIMNQVRSDTNRLDKPDWLVPNVGYELLTLKEALNDNPSVTITLLYQNLAKTLYKPLTFRKNKPSFMDLFFAEKPQCLLSDTSNIIDREEEIKKKHKLFYPAVRIHKRHK